MIRANELRIGNLINKNGKVHYTNIFTIRDIKYLSIDDTDIFEPIEISEEWLSKFGFQKRDRAYKLKNFGKFLFFDGDPQFYPAGMLNALLPKGNLQFVHQLQNIYFALTGEELQLK